MLVCVKSKFRVPRAVRLVSLLSVGLSTAGMPVVMSAQQSGAQTDAPVPQNKTPLENAATTGAPVLRGNVVDPDGAEIPGATVTLAPATGKSFIGTSGADGTYALRGVPAGTYNLAVTMPGFASFVRQGVKIGGAALTVNVKLTIADQNTVVNVTSEQNVVSVDPDNNASSQVLKGKDLDALSDDPDELASELSALAGPAAGPNGGQIYIDGFTGGQLPPKSSIREIRINQNPFSAEYDRPGFGRVEVFTKPGTDKLHGSFTLSGTDKSFDTGSVFITPGTFQPDYHTVLGYGSLTGPINKSASYSLSGSFRDIQDNQVIDPASYYGTTAGVACSPATTTGCVLTYNAVQFQPQTRYEISPRVDLALGDKNTLTARFQFEHNNQMNQGIGGNNLASTGYNSLAQETTIQISDTQIFSAKVINETRFEYQRPTSNETPFSTAPTLDVQGGFVSGGSTTQTEQDTENHIELQNYTSIALAKHFIRAGGRLRTTSETSTTTANANGEFSYTSLANYLANTLPTFQITNIAQPTISARETDLGLYAEDDWKIRPNLTFSYGLRYELQNFIPDHTDFAPRLAVAYGLGKKTVVRAGMGWFYDRFSLGNQLSVYRNNGVNQQIITVSNISAAAGATCNPGNTTGCVALQGTSGKLTERVLELSGAQPFHQLTSPYQIQENLGVDEALFKGATLSVNYQHIRGVHQFNSDVPNANPTGRFTLSNPLLYQYQSNGVFDQNQLVLNVNYRGKYGSLGSYYVLNFAKSDTSGAGSFASVPNDLAADYGRASFDQRNRVFLFGSFTLPHLISLSPFLVAQSGSPYNITSGQDVYGDNIYNGRALLVANGTAGSRTIAGCGTFAAPAQTSVPAPGSLAPINYCTGPANFTLNLRVQKTFGFGESRTASAQDGNGPGGSGGPPGSSGSHSHSGGSSGRSGGSGGFGGGGASSGKRYNFSLGAYVANVFNVADRGTPIGVFTSPLFGQSNTLNTGLFTTNSAIRRIQLLASFNF